ncbi:MAG: PQQ-dependent sugar dehydrogenase [Cyclobacteriaceae bacterium]|nr:PQQ-dependent sugar dehydrogenase [Cyclobacteriaceae bacterium]
MNILLALIIFGSSCVSNNENETPDQESNSNYEYIKSEKLSYRIDTLATGLDNPWGLTFLPNKDLLVTERDGEIRIIREGKLLEQSITGVPDVYNKGQGGLFEIQLHPDYQSNGWLYIAYAAPVSGGGNTAIMRAKLGGFNLINKSVIFQAEPFVGGGNHFGGRMEFGNDGQLYFSVGERGNKSNAQTLKNHAGKILRISEDGSVPSDNPFVRTSGAKPEIYTYGNRNPQGMAIHPTTGEIWTHEHGPMGGDEINIVKKGVNYGWPEVSYGKNYDGSILTEYTTKKGMEDPLHYWVPSIAPCGMSFVTSEKYGDWKGNLLVGSLKFRYVARLELDGDKVTHEERIAENLGRVRAITQGPDGYIYVSTEGPGMVIRLVPK